MESYFSRLEEGSKRAYLAATKARSIGVDPETYVEIPPARDMASRVEKLLSKWHVDGVADRIRELSKTNKREMVAMLLAEELALDESRGSREARLEVALRVGLAVITEGILVAPLEGLVHTNIREDPAGAYVDLYYAGPIRAAGGTAQALSVLMADYVRRKLGLAAYKATSLEIGRYKEEIPLYKHVQHLQYLPTPYEIEQVVSHVPVCINGEPTEKGVEVTAFRNVPRVQSPGIRGGACLVIAEGICQKAAKLRKIAGPLGLDGWEFLEHLGKKGEKTEAGASSKYLEDAVGGRPILAHPNREGGFRLVYGRGRTTGLAATALNPATMAILRNFVAIGTQLKTEFPGKATVTTPCDTIEGPLVLLDDGSFVAVNELARARELLPRVKKIVDLGEILVSYGEFLENNHALQPGSYSLPWHLEEVRAKGLPIDRKAISPTWEEAMEYSSVHGVPLHPSFNLFWHDLFPMELAKLSTEIENKGTWRDSRLVVPEDPGLKEAFLTLGLLHGVSDGHMVVDGALSRSFLLGLGLEAKDEGIVRRMAVNGDAPEIMAEVSRLAGIRVKARAPTRLGARIGRPEKARHREMTPAVHTLFPVEMAGGVQRSLNKVADLEGPGNATVSMGIRHCPSCGTNNLWTRCSCGAHTESTGQVATRTLPVGDIFRKACKSLSVSPPEMVKGVRGLSSKLKTPELLEKGILRAIHGISIYQDGTSRFDLTDIPLTHFRPAEIGLSLEKAKELGYTVDWTGEPLNDASQVLELKPQDIVPSNSCGEYLLSLSQFLDDELKLIYQTDQYYKAKTPEDLIGQLVIALAPHTSGGVLGRIIGYTNVEACFAHPAFHASKRRNCDGDEDSVTLLMDGLLNFSFAYLPETRGAFMDKPLVLTTRLDAREVDKEAHNVDISAVYPLKFYEKAEQYASPSEVEPLFDLVKKRLENVPEQFRGYAFTHDTTDIAQGTIRSAYRESGGMKDMVADSMAIMAQIRAVDLGNTVARVLNRHFLPDIMGNMTSYATQKFRCKKCGASYRRPPLIAKCTAQHGRDICGGDLLATVYEGSVKKYMALSKGLASQDGVGNYLRQRVGILEGSLTALFPAYQKQLLNYVVEERVEPDNPPD
jgi:DNA polymerase II large subunit